jgi:hypothetical protein
MPVRDISRREWPNEETDKEIAKHRGQPEPSADRTGERRREQHNPNLEYRGSFRHIRTLLGVGTRGRSDRKDRTEARMGGKRHSSTSVCAQPARPAHAR